MAPALIPDQVRQEETRDRVNDDVVVSIAGLMRDFDLVLAQHEDGIVAHYTHVNEIERVRILADVVGHCLRAGLMHTNEIDGLTPAVGHVDHLDNGVRVVVLPVFRARMCPRRRGVVGVESRSEPPAAW